MVQGSTTSLLYYDGDGNMVEANEAHTKVYSYEGNSILYSKDLHTATVTKEIYAGALHLAEVVGGTTYYDHVDALGSVREQTTGSITISTTTDYKPYGDTYQKSGSITFGYVRAPTRTEISTSYRVLW